MKKTILSLMIVFGLISHIKPAHSSEEELYAIVKRLEARITELEKQLQSEQNKNQKIVRHEHQHEIVKTNQTLEQRVAALESNSTTDKHEHRHDSYIKPNLGVVFNGAYRNYSQGHTHIRGFQIGHEGEKPDEGFSLGESEITLGANIDDRFYGNLTLAVVNEDGEDKIEIEEAYIKTLALPYGMEVKAGRMLPTFGYLNNKHLHTDDFSDRPLPYRTFMNNHYKDDGVQLSLTLPTDFHSEIGAGLYKGAHFPADSDGNSDIGSYNIYARIGDDVNNYHSWQTGLSYLHAKSKNGGRTDAHGHSHHDLTFEGENDFYAFDAKYSFAPTGDKKEQEITLQGEYIFRRENGKYDIGNGFHDFDSNATGWYAQTTYKFMPEWRVGYRYSELNPKKAPAEFIDTILDNKAHKPSMHSAMVEWDSSEFSRIRLQYNYDNSDIKPDNQFILQYTMGFSTGGHHHK